MCVVKPAATCFHHLFCGGGGKSKLVCTSHESTGFPVVPAAFFLFAPFFPGALIHGTGGGGTVEMARPMPGNEVRGTLAPPNVATLYRHTEFVIFPMQEQKWEVSSKCEF